MLEFNLFRISGINMNIIFNSFTFYKAKEYFKNKTNQEIISSRIEGVPGCTTSNFEDVWDTPFPVFSA